MVTQKAALVGCKEGPWISTSNMPGLRLKVKGGEDIHVRVEQPECDAIEVIGAGIHRLTDAAWTRVSVIGGSAGAAFCFLIAGAHEG
jgi:hypothetical protein